MSTVRVNSLADLCFNSGIVNVFLQGAVNLSGIYPRKLYTTFLAVQLGSFALASFTHPDIYNVKSEAHHIDQIEHYASGDWGFHNPDISSPTLWHALLAAPFYILNIKPGIYSLRLFSLLQVLIFPALVTFLTLPPSSSSRCSNLACFLHALRTPSEYALVISLNPLLVRANHKMDPVLTTLLCVLLYWGLSHNNKKFAASGFCALVGLLSARGMVWMVFLTAYGVCKGSQTAVSKRNPLLWLFGILTILIWALAWTLPTVPSPAYLPPSFDQAQDLGLIRYSFSAWDTYISYLLFEHRSFFIPFLLVTLLSFCLPSSPSPSTSHSWSSLSVSDKLLPIFILRLFLFSHQLREESIEDVVTSQLERDDTSQLERDETSLPQYDDLLEEDGGEGGRGRAARLVARMPWGAPLQKNQVMYTTRLSPSASVLAREGRTLNVSEQARRRNEDTGRVKHAGKIEVGWDLFLITLILVFKWL
ncbi:hypothetical protein IAR50_005405 [Cryptococcus sp. DSM 104548]